jgi:hypothetical protein
VEKAPSSDSSPIRFKTELRDKVIPYARAIDPLNESVSAFVQECVTAIIDLIETEPSKRVVPSIVLRACAGLQKHPLPIAESLAKNYPHGKKSGGGKTQGA